MQALRRASKARHSREKRRQLAIEARVRSREATDDDSLLERDRTIFAQTLTVWKSTTDIARDLATWPEFKSLDFSSVRKAVIRSCKSLVSTDWLESEMRVGTRRQKLLFVRRRAAVHGGFVSETPGQNEKGLKSEVEMRQP
jgi:hypothetical protein